MQQNDHVETKILKLGAVLLILGVIVTNGVTMLHPSKEKADDNSNVFREYAQSNTWTNVHLGQFLGFLFMFCGMIILAYSLRVEKGNASTWSRLALPSIVVTMAVGTILQAVDGISLKMAVDDWALAPADEKTIAFRVAEGIRWTEIGINSLFNIFNGITIMFYGIAVGNSTNYPKAKLLGIIGIVSASGTILAGLHNAYFGFRGDSLAMIAFPMIILGNAWVITMGILMWKRASRIFST